MQPELHSQTVDVIGKGPQLTGEFCGIFAPVADVARPAEVDHEKLDPEARGGAGVFPENVFVDVGVVSPGVPAHIGKPLRSRSGERRFGESLRAEAGFVPVALEQPDKSAGDLERRPWKYGVIQRL